MLTDYHTLVYIASSLSSRVPKNAVVEAFSQERDELVLRLSRLDEVIIISCDRFVNTLYLRPNFVRSRANSIDVLGRCLGQTIVEVRMHPVDRVVMLMLESGDRLDARFFGSKSNVVLVEKGGAIVDAFRNAKATVGGKTEYRSGSIVYDVHALRTRLATPRPITITTMMKEEFPTLGATLMTEILHRAGIPGNLGAISITESHILAIQTALDAVLGEITRPTPRIYCDNAGQHLHFSIVPLTHLEGWEEKKFDDVHEAIRFLVARLRSRQSVEGEKQMIVGKLTHTLHKARRTLAAVEADLRNHARAGEYQRYGELLMAHLHELSPERGSTQLVVQDIGTTIPLQATLSPVQNAQRYFEKAKRSRAAQQHAAERVEQLRALASSAERLLRRAEQITTREEMRQFMTAHGKELDAFGIGRKSEEREQLPFRVFTVDGGFEVWVGKSSTSNDQLTLKYAKPDDLWFHARGAAGSHVILKTKSGKGEPGKKAKEQAAGIAAYYSKMKNARMVPVAMTERKYVRKPKGAAPGSVTIEREKVIFAEPALPTEKEEGKA
jgi:predicted ribosome quality control (RQC) complex YloA/Tae2 family protein